MMVCDRNCVTDENVIHSPSVNLPFICVLLMFRWLSVWRIDDGKIHLNWWEQEAFAHETIERYFIWFVWLVATTSDTHFATFLIFLRYASVWVTHIHNQSVDQFSHNRAWVRARTIPLDLNPIKLKLVSFEIAHLSFYAILSLAKVLVFTIIANWKFKCRWMFFSPPFHSMHACSTLWNG